MKQDRISARAFALWALPLLASCGSPAAPARDAATDARGCSNWPNRAGDGFISLDGASAFEVESFLVERQGDLALAALARVAKRFLAE